MPKGTKIVDWTPENEAKLFHTIMAVHDIKVDNAKVAEAFGKFRLEPGPCSVLPHILDDLTIRLFVVMLFACHVTDILIFLPRS